MKADILQFTALLFVPSFGARTRPIRFLEVLVYSNIRVQVRLTPLYYQTLLELGSIHGIQLENFPQNNRTMSPLIRL